MPYALTCTCTLGAGTNTACPLHGPKPAATVTSTPAPTQAEVRAALEQLTYGHKHCTANCPNLRARQLLMQLVEANERLREQLAGRSAVAGARTERMDLHDELDRRFLLIADFRAAVAAMGGTGSR